MGKSAMLDIQTAIVLRLRADPTLNSLITGIFDEIPIDQSYPYVQVGDQSEGPFNTFNRFGRDVTFTISIWSIFEGFEESFKILTEINRLLDFQTFTINNFDQVLIRFVDSNTIRDNVQRETRSSAKQIAASYQVIVQEQ